MKIETKFDVGDCVYCIIRNTLKEARTLGKCPICEGTRTITIKNKQFKCPECLGFGKISKFKSVTKYSYVRGYIGSIDITNNISYWIMGEFNKIFKEEQIFKTEEEAKNYCNSKNGQSDTKNTRS